MHKGKSRPRIHSSGIPVNGPEKCQHDKTVSTSGQRIPDNTSPLSTADVALVDQLKARLPLVIKEIADQLGMPSDDVIHCIAREHKLSDDQATALKRTMMSILGFKGDIQVLERKLGSLSASSKSLARVEKHFRLLRSEVNKSRDQLDHFLLNYADRPVAQVGMGQFYLDVIDALYLPIKELVDHNKLNRGGRPKIWTRDLVVEMLARNSQGIIGRCASATADGPFVRLCASVLEALGLSSDGLEEFVERKMEERDLREAAVGR